MKKVFAKNSNSNVRSMPDTDSSVITTVTNTKGLEYILTTPPHNGKAWYAVKVGNKTGYVRSDVAVLRDHSENVLDMVEPKVDKVTKERISKLHPTIRQEVTNIVNEINTALTGRAKVRISQGTRTNAEQDALYAQGRTKPGKIVTNAKGGQSIHNYSLAVDIVLILDGKTASWSLKEDFDKDGKADWMECVSVFKKYGWVWGGDWRFKDSPHFEKPNMDWQKLSRMKRDKDGYVIL